MTRSVRPFVYCWLISVSASALLAAPVWAEEIIQPKVIKIDPQMAENAGFQADAATPQETKKTKKKLLEPREKFEVFVPGPAVQQPTPIATQLIDVQLAPAAPVAKVQAINIPKPVEPPVPQTPTSSTVQFLKPPSQSLPTPLTVAEPAPQPILPSTFTPPIATALQIDGGLPVNLKAQAPAPDSRTNINSKSVSAAATISPAPIDTSFITRVLAFLDLSAKPAIAATPTAPKVVAVPPEPASAPPAPVVLAEIKTSPAPIAPTPVVKMEPDIVELSPSAGGEFQVAQNNPPPPSSPLAIPNQQIAPVQKAAAAPAAQPTPVATVNNYSPVPVPSQTPAYSLPPLPSSVTSSEPDPALSGESKKIIDKIKPEKQKKKAAKTEKVGIDHSSVAPMDGVDTQESMGMRIEVKRPSMNANYELEKAYNAILTGNSDMAVEIYNNVLEQEPKNVDALFGLATIYHRAGQLEKARPLYGQILQINPNHKGALNNFLSLASDESPVEAVTRLKTMEQRSPTNATLAAQLAVAYQKNGQYHESISAMLRAVNLEPENLSYRYNLAIMFDKLGQRPEAIALYLQLVDAYLKGAKLPGDIRQIQERLTFLRSNR